MISNTKKTRRTRPAKRGLEASRIAPQVGSFASGCATNAIPNPALAPALETLAKIFGEFLLLLNTDDSIRAIWTSNGTVLHRPSAILVGECLPDIVSAGQYEPLANLLRGIRRNGHTFHAEHPVRDDAGTRWFSFRSTLVFHRTKSSPVICLSGRDVSARKRTEEDLKKSRALLAQAEQFACLGSWEHDFSTGTLTWSDNLYRLFGVQPREAPPSKELFWSVVHPDDRELAIQARSQAIDTRQPSRARIRCVRHDGRELILCLRIFPMLSETGELLRLAGVVQDVTDRTQSEEALKRSEALLAQAEHLARLGSFEVDLQSDSVIWSDQLYRNLGLNPGDPMTLSRFRQMVHPEDRERVIQELHESLRQKAILDSEFRCILANGDVRTLHRRALPIYNHTGEPQGFIGMSQDVTERQRAAEDLRKSAALLSLSERLTHTGSWEFDLQTAIPTWSDNMYRLFGFEPREIVPTESLFWEIVVPDERDRIRRFVAEAVATRRAADYEMRCKIKDGRTRIFHTHFTVTFSDADEPLCLVGSSQDITERRQAEDRIRKIEALQAQAEELANLGSWEWNLETKEIIWSEQRYRLAGLDPSAPPPSMDSFWDFVHPEDREKLQSEIAAAIAHCVPLEHETRFVRADQTVQILHTRILPIPNASGRTIRLVGMSQDVTARRQEEDRLRRSEALLDQAEAIAGLGSWEQDLATGKTLFSNQLLRMYGLRSQDAWDEEWYWHHVQIKDRDLVRNSIKDAVAQCKPFEYVARFRLPGAAVKTYHTRGVPVPGPDGTAERIRGVVHDITGQRHTEEGLHRLSQELLRTQDSERRQIARDLHESAGQTLAALKMTLANLAEVLPEGNSEACEHIQAARALAEDAIREVRVVSYLMHPPMLDEAGLGPALQWYARGYSGRSGIETAVHVSRDLGRLPQEIETTIFRIVQEALTNIHRYSGSRVAIIRLGCKKNEVFVEIQDQGCGLQFVQLRRSSRLGVGIAGMRERVKQLHGAFEIESAPGCGTTVRVVLPLPDALLHPGIASGAPDQPMANQTAREVTKQMDGLAEFGKGD